VSKTGKSILNAELKAFFSTAKFCQESDFSNVVEIKKFTSKQLENAIHSARIVDTQVKADVSKGRIKRLTHYLDFLYDEIHADQSVSAKVIERKHTIQCKYKTEIRSLKDFNQQCRDLNESPLPNAKLVELLEMIKPESAKNPFKHCRLRNNLIFKLITETGIRRGAAAKLKISDCKFHGSYDQINITRTPNDPTDARTIKAQQKTKPHPAFITPDTLRHIKHYIDTTHDKFAKSAKHDFIFVTEMDSKGTVGQPLSLNSVNSISRILSRAVGMRVHPHLLRYK
jgi:integrase